MSRGRMSIDVQVKVSIDNSSQVSIDCSSQVSVDGFDLLSIDAARFSLRIVCYKRTGSEKSMDFSLLLLVLLDIHLKEFKKKKLSELSITIRT